MPARVKSALEKLIGTYSTSLCSEPARLKGLLYDICPSKRKEITALLLVIQEGLVSELRRGGSNFRLKSLAARLHNNTGIDERLAEWALTVWADALGLGAATKPQRRSRTRESATAALRLSRQWIWSLFGRYKTGILLSGIFLVVLTLLVMDKEYEKTPIALGEQCKITASTKFGESNGTLYHDKHQNRARADFQTRSDDRIISGHFIIHDSWMYFWIDDESTGLAMEVVEAADPKKAFKPITSFECDTWVPTNVFNLPSEVNFRRIPAEEAVKLF